MALQHIGRPPGTSRSRHAPAGRTRRRRWPLALSLGAALLLLLGAGWLAARSAAERAVRRAVQARGGTVSYGSLSLRWPLGVHLEDATLQLPGLRLEGASLSARAALWASLRAGGPCEVDLEVAARSAEVAPQRLAETWRRPRTSQRHEGTGRCRRLRTARVRLEQARVAGWEPPAGTLSVRRLRAGWDATARRLDVEVGATSSSAGLHAEDASVRLAWPAGAEGPAVERARLGSVRLRLAPLLASLRQALSRWTDAPGEDKGEPGEAGLAKDAAAARRLPIAIALEKPVRVDRLVLEDDEGGRLEGAASVHLEDGRLSLEVRTAEGAGGARYALRARLPWPPAGLAASLRAASVELRFERLPGGLLGAALPEVPWASPEATTLDGTLRLEGDEPPRWQASLTVRDAVFEHRRLAPRPVHLPALRLEGHGTLAPAARRVTLQEGSLAADAVRVTLAGALWRSAEGLGLEATATLPPTACGEVLGTLPEALRKPALDGFAWTGTMEGRMLVAVDPARLDESRLRITVRDRCEFARVPAWARAERLRGPFAYRIVAADGTERTRRSGPGTDDWVPLSRVGPFLLHAILAAEDAAFFRHHGFAPWAIEEAFRRNLAAGRFVQGASTLTMQLARNLFLHRDKTLARKAQEVVLTWWLERALTKAEILERYVNVVEFGPDVYGIGPAAAHYFGRAPSELSVAESAFLASVLPSPRRYHRSFELGRLTESMARRVGRLLRHMAERGRIDEQALQEGLAELQAGLRFRGPEETVAPPRPAPLGRAAPLPIESAAGTDATEGPWPVELPELQDDAAEPTDSSGSPSVSPVW